MVAPWTQIEVRAKRLRLDGTPATGHIRIKPYPKAMTHIPSSTVVIPAYGIVMQLDDLGEGSILLPATDDPEFDTVDWTYYIKEEIDGKTIAYSRELPLSLELTGLDLTEVIGLPLPGNPVSLITQAIFDALETRVDVLEGEVIFGGDWADIDNKPSTFPPSVHTHDDRYFTEAEITTSLATKADTGHTHSHFADTANPHAVTKAQVGLANAEDTSDLTKVISTATQAALDDKVTRIWAKRTIAGNYTLVLGDTQDMVMHSTSDTAITITLPPNGTVAIAQEVAIPWRQYGAGLITFVGGAGVTLISRGSLFKSAGQYAEGTLTKTGTNVWLLSGDIAA